MSKEAILIEKAKGFATENYENGYDRFVECYEREQWHEFVTDENGELMSWSQIKKRMESIASVWSEKAAWYDH